ncbi:hypothetical protein HNP55_002813 [Paucibacter oligotrophus]|uniref:Uncharacterized protein n=1 Tax=Roseateles oligotrophus TaxID=1769250 RepID=A0A840LG59_9BURK|nr:hypothetical protein [Roseateles oligotrophus]
MWTGSRTALRSKPTIPMAISPGTAPVGGAEQGLQQGPMNLALSLSRVHNSAPGVIRVEASSCMSIRPQPRPYRRSLCRRKWSTHTEVSTSTSFIDRGMSSRRRGISGISAAAPPNAAKRFAVWMRTKVLTASRS